MTDNTLPEVGSRWILDWLLNKTPAEVTKVTKRGRGWQVWVSQVEGVSSPVRLADFRKQAKPA